MNNVTIVIPIKNPRFIKIFINKNLHLFNNYQTIVIDSGGGELIKNYSSIYINQDLTMSQARKMGINLVNTKYTLNLDVDNILPKNYIKEAIVKLNDKVKAVAIDYDRLIGHYGFGTSLWETETLKKLYDYNENDYLCECNRMWKKLIGESNLMLETLPYRAINLKTVHQTFNI